MSPRSRNQPSWLSSTWPPWAASQRSRVSCEKERMGAKKWAQGHRSAAKKERTERTQVLGQLQRKGRGQLQRAQGREISSKAHRSEVSAAERTAEHTGTQVRGQLHSHEAGKWVGYSEHLHREGPCAHADAAASRPKQLPASTPAPPPTHPPLKHRCTLLLTRRGPTHLPPTWKAGPVGMRCLAPPTPPSPIQPPQPNPPPPPPPHTPTHTHPHPPLRAPAHPPPTHPHPPGRLAR